jgi:hypothetical protein
MNTRLVNQYLAIEEQNKEKFLVNQVEIDATWGKEIWGVTLQIDLGEEVKNQLETYQRELDEMEPNNLLLLPREYQHISFNQVVFWGGEYKLGNEKTWEDSSKEFLKEFNSLYNSLSSFEVNFAKVVATTGGIIWCATDENDELEGMRNKFLQILPFPTETTKLNHIIHTTVARYKNKLNDPKKVFDCVSSKNEIVSMKIKSIILKKELIFPSIKTETIAKIDLV